jgi:hypothetical protein
MATEVTQLRRRAFRAYVFDLDRRAPRFSPCV